MSDDLTTLEAAKLATGAPIPLDNQMVVIAKDPHEMQVSQAGLIEWFLARVASAQLELTEAESNLATAKARKWATDGWRRQVQLAAGRVTFYQKCLAALEAGYIIVPDFPTEIFAVRTERRRPRPNTRKQKRWSPSVRLQVPDAAPVGTGEYVSPHAALLESTRKVEGKNFKGEPEEVTEHTVWADEYLPPDFPMKRVKPQILDATGKAMARKIFDEMGVLPARRSMTGRRQGDPIVTGRIVRREGAREIGLTFLVSWWIDTRDL